MGRTTSVWDPSARPIEPLTATRGIGSASGFEGSTSCRVAGTTRFPDARLHDEFGLVRLATALDAFRGRKREFLSESRMREIRPSGSMSGEWKRSLSHRATPRLYYFPRPRLLRGNGPGA